MTSLTSFLCLLLILNIFHTFSSVSIVKFEQVNACWDVNRYENPERVVAISANKPMFKVCN